MPASITHNAVPSPSAFLGAERLQAPALEGPGTFGCEEPANWLGMSARVCNEKFEPIAQVPIVGWPRKVGLANGNRIVACVNACAGIPDPTALRAQRDQLLAACKAGRRIIVAAVESACSGRAKELINPNDHAAVKEIDAAIALTERTLP